MPVYQRIINLDEVFNNINYEPIILNDLSGITVSDRSAIEDIIKTKYAEDQISNIAKCSCGDLIGEYLIGTVCPSCHTSVIKNNNEFQHSIWIRCPDNIDSLINPVFWTMLENFLTKSNVNVLQWLTDKTYKPTSTNTKILNLVSKIPNMERGFNYFIRNFDYIINELMQIREFTDNQNNKIVKNDILDVIEKYRDNIFTKYMPLPDKSLIVVEHTSKGIYLDYNIAEILDAVYIIINSNNARNRNMENRVSKVQNKISSYYKGYLHKFFGGHGGIFRKHVFGTRTHFSYRAVISSITEPHKYDDIYLPWGIGLTVFRPMIINKLVRLGYVLNDAISLIYSSIHKYNDTLDKILNELIREAGGRIPTTIQRNPSLGRGSALLVGIPKIKTDPSDNTISMSILVTASLNADFDGDEENGQLLLDAYMKDLFYTLSPHFNILGMKEVGEVTSNLQIPKPTVAILSNWLSQDIETDTNKVKLMEQMFTRV